VSDADLLKELERINEVQEKTISSLMDLDDEVPLENPSVDFATLASLTDEDKKKYLATTEDCGDDKLNVNHYNACVGLRNLRI
jgi:hypothetical protein